MTDGLKPYPEYKDTGLPWLECIPAHWDLRRIKTIAIINPSKSEAEQNRRQNLSVIFLPMERVGTDGRLDCREKRPATEVWNGLTYFRRGDVIVAKITPCFENGKGACLESLPTQIGFGSTEFHVLRPRSRISAQFLYLVTTEPKFRKLGADNMTGTAGQKRVPTEFVKNCPIALPPRKEQDAIVRFLDHANRRIDRYIRAKRNLIALLNEQKQAIIQRAVTRGLDPDVQMKRSGVDWLDDVPEHWKVLRAKQLFREVDNRSATGTEVLLSLRMHKGLVPHNEVSSVPIAAEALIGFKKVMPGQLVMNRMRAAIGMFGVARQPGLVSPDYAVFQPSESADACYFLHIFKTRAACSVFRMESKGLGTGSSGFMRLYTDRFGIIKLPVPECEEQKAIVQGISVETAEINRTEDRINREIALVREYRTRLIADVVTGQLDVREAAARLPDEMQEPEPLYADSDDAEGIEADDEPIEAEA